MKRSLFFLIILSMEGAGASAWQVSSHFIKLKCVTTFSLAGL